MIQTNSSLGDQRLNQTYLELIERACNRLSLVVHRIAEDRAQEVRFGRLLRHKDLCRHNMIKMGVEFSLSDTTDRHVLLVQDTSELSFGLDPFQSDLSEVGSGSELGFYVHPVIALDSKSHICLGLANAEAFKRADQHGYRNKSKFEDKQSYRWLSSIVEAKKNCGQCKGITVISDREGDIYDALCGYKDAGLDFVIRSWHNRPLAEENAGFKLQEKIDSWAPQGSYQCDLPRTDKRSAHKATLEVKFGKVAIGRPEKSVSKHLAPTLEVYVIEVKEHPSTVVNREQPIHWRLITSHPVNSLEDAQMIIIWYTKRWLIEQVFRLLKKQGLDFMKSLVHDYETLSRLAIVGLIAAVRVLQLITARNNPDNTTASIAFSDLEMKIIEALSPALEGKTTIQKNPHPPQTLAFAVWVIARLGGWKSYSKSERPPGPITFLNGLKRLENYIDIQLLINNPNASA